MTKKYHVFVCLFLIIFGLGVAACAQSPNASPSAWIDYPRDGDTLMPGEPVTVMSHAFAREGVAEVVLSVNGEAYRRDAPTAAENNFASVEQAWVPVEAGIYTLQVQVYDRNGQPGDPAVISVEVGGELPTLVPTAVDTVTSVATSVITATPVITATAVVVTTVPPPPPTEPPPPPTEPPAAPADTTPPPVPSPFVPANGLELPCRASQNLVWLPVNDPSGIAGYYVKLEMEVTAGQWQSAGGYGPVSDKQVSANVQCGVHYRWMVRAQDGAGNYSNWSAPSDFSISMN